MALHGKKNQVLPLSSPISSLSYYVKKSLKLFSILFFLYANKIPSFSCQWQHCHGAFCLCFTLPAWGRLGPATLYYSACTWTDVLFEKQNRNSMTEITTRRGSWVNLWTIRYKKAEASCHFWGAGSKAELRCTIPAHSPHPAGVGPPTPLLQPRPPGVPPSSPHSRPPCLLLGREQGTCYSQSKSQQSLD